MKVYKNNLAIYFFPKQNQTQDKSFTAYDLIGTGLFKTALINHFKGGD